GGYVDKFIGDAVMAVWGAPIRSDDHGKNAIAAAINYHRAVDSLNEKLKNFDSSSYDPNIFNELTSNRSVNRVASRQIVGQIAARVGVHSGEAIVGNIGSSKRHNYTAIGDTVNLASRLEGIGKQYHCNLIISEETVNLLLSDEVILANLLLIDQIRVKGKKTATKIYTTLYTDNSPLPSELQLRQLKELYYNAFVLYQKQEFHPALQALTDFNKSASLLNFGPALVLKERIEDILKNGIPNNYENGVWSFYEK
ncbi:MAG: adenylate/guanylate cyclase domain-containing protein, partial [Oligoflexia bacterium]|nr:adenylate/guanylate cyclase domain-containing protein [Oligoflexia bacterium]